MSPEFLGNLEFICTPWVMARALLKMHTIILAPMQWGPPSCTEVQVAPSTGLPSAKEMSSAVKA